MKVLLDNLPASLRGQQEILDQCLRAMDQVAPLQRVYLFGSHARGEARADSDVDLCLVTEDAGQQLETARKCREAIWDVWPRPALTLVPITPQRLTEKEAIGDYFFQTVLKEGVLLATQD